MIWSVRPKHGHRIPQKKKTTSMDHHHHDKVSIIKAWWGDIGMKSEVGKCGKTRWPQVCRVQTIGIAFTPLTRIFMFMKSGLQHEISAGRFLSLWGLSLVHPPFPDCEDDRDLFFQNHCYGFEQRLFELKVRRPKFTVFWRVPLNWQFPCSRGFTVNFD